MSSAMRRADRARGSLTSPIWGRVTGLGRSARAPKTEPLVAASRREAEAIRVRELDRTLRDLGDIDPRTAERIAHLSRTLVKKVLHEPTVRLRERAGAGEADEVAAAIRELFGVAARRDPWPRPRRRAAVARAA